MDSDIAIRRGNTREIDWRNLGFVVLTPLAALASAWLFLTYRDLGWGEVVSFTVMMALSGLGIGAGYHRYYAHRAYQCRPAVQVGLLLAGAATMEESLLHWASDHRRHHRFVDSDNDPYNIKAGAFWAHVGWMLQKSGTERTFENSPDLTSDKYVMWQHKYYLPIAIFMTFGLPTLIGLAFGEPLGGFIFGGLVRVVLFQHATFLVNSAAHFIGSQKYSTAHSGRDSWWLSLFTFGEGFHNYHHTFQGDYRTGIRWWHYDPNKWLIRTLAALHLAWGLHKAPARAIAEARKKVAESMAAALSEKRTRTA